MIAIKNEIINGILYEVGSVLPETENVKTPKEPKKDDLEILTEDSSKVETTTETETTETKKPKKSKK